MLHTVKSTKSVSAISIEVLTANVKMGYFTSMQNSFSSHISMINSRSYLAKHKSYQRTKTGNISPISSTCRCIELLLIIIAIYNLYYLGNRVNNGFSISSPLTGADETIFIPGAMIGYQSSGGKKT